jgi:poly-gamma-glutamate capsule biosynthesis protein CapA/YwtB (metallophosphatase superfamily)
MRPGNVFLLFLLPLVLLPACQLSPEAPAGPGPVPVLEEITVYPITEEAQPTQTPVPSPSLTPISSPTPRPSPTPTITPTPDPIITLLFTGIIVPARCVQAAIDARGDPDFIYDEVRELIMTADLAVATLNATMTDFSPRTGCVSTFVLVGGSENAGAMKRAGFDAVSVATNHIKNCNHNNCGDRAFFDTLENLLQAGVLPVGAGANHNEALQPVVLEAKGVRFGIVSLGQIEPMAFASETTPGIAVLTDNNLKEAIEMARAVSDVVIAMPHWGPEYSPIPNYLQIHFADKAVEFGADMVVGNHTHVVQAVEEIDGVQVFYGLGNFIFDQDWSRETQQAVILKVFYEGARYLGYELIPTFTEGSGRVRFADDAEAAEIFDRIEDASRKIYR